MSEKVKAHHLERGAYVYVRQSTPYQVRNNLESKDRQYALEGRAQQLGFSKVVVIDEDLGPLRFRHSGAAGLRPVIGISLPGSGRSGVVMSHDLAPLHSPDIRRCVGHTPL
jgi:hypothetical protein